MRVLGSLATSSSCVRLSHLTALKLLDILTMPTNASSPIAFHPDYASPIRPPADNVILRSEDGTAFYFDFRVLQKHSGFFKGLTDLPQPMEASNTLGERVFSMPSTSTRALHLVRRVLVHDFFSPRFILTSSEYDPDLPDLLLETLVFADTYDVNLVRKRLAERVTKEPFLQYALTLVGQPSLADRLVPNLVRNHKVSEMPPAALAVLSEHQPQALAALDRLYRVRRFDYNWDQVRTAILDMKIRAIQYSTYRYRCPKHGDTKRLSLAEYEALRPLLVTKLSCPADLETLSAMKATVMATLGCEEEACAQPLLNALNWAKFPVPTTVKGLLDLEERQEKEEAKRLAKEKRKKDKAEARKRKRVEEAEDEDDSEDEDDGDDDA